MRQKPHLARRTVMGIACCLAAAASASCAHADTPVQLTRPSGGRDLYSDTWIATDDLGRTTPTAGGGGAPTQRKDRFVGVFYFIHNGAATPYSSGTRSFGPSLPGPVYDNTKILAQMNGDRSRYGEFYKNPGGYWWGEPMAGYYVSDDPWVIRHDLAMLSDAGVDVILFDVTNGPTFAAAYTMVCKTAEEMRRAGDPTPQIAFVTYANGVDVINRLWDEFYAKNLYSDLWFRWQGKPLLLGEPVSSLRPEIRNFFTWRKCWAYTPRPKRDGRWFGDGHDAWPWLDDYPQGFGWHDDSKTPEEMPVTIAGHAVESLGRSFQGTWGAGGTEPPLDKYDLAADTPKGLYFDQQWKRALEADPTFVFVTSWNEWTAFSYVQKPPTRANMANRDIKDGQFYFIDEYNAEFSRDAMPVKGGFGDNYYLQLAQNVRRYKGARPAPTARGFHTLPPNGSITAWDRIAPEYRDAVGDTAHRDWAGAGGNHYNNTTGRNDIVSAKVACDASTIYFYVRTQAPLTPDTDPDWMQLLIDTDRNPKTGWNGYDFIASRALLKRFSDGKTWPIKYRVDGDKLVLAIPRALLGLNNANRTAFDFHWVDNAPVGPGADIVSWWYDGDSAPDGRFNYRYACTR